MPAIGRATFTFALLGGSEEAQIALWWAPRTTGTLEQLRDSLAGAIPSWFTPYKAYLPTTCSLADVTVQAIDDGTGVVLRSLPVTRPDDTVGTDANHSLPTQCASVITLRTVTSGRSFRGRIYQPPFTTGVLTSNADIGASDRVAITTYWKSLLDGVVADGDWVPVVYSRKLRVPTEVESIDMGSVIDTQRRRRQSLTESRSTAVITT